MSKIFRRRKPKAKQKTAKEFAFRKIGLRKMRKDLKEIEKLLKQQSR